MQHLLSTLMSVTVAVLVTASCATESPKTPVMPVIEGWIDSDGFPVVQFTASIIPGQDESNLEDKILNWGKVTIDDGEKTVIMTGGPAKNYFPPYRYYTYNMKGQPGRTYTVTAEYEELIARASCTMPEPTPIDSIRLEPIEGNDTLRAATLCFTAPKDCPAHYYVTLRKAERGERPYPAMLSTVEVTQPGLTVEIPVLNPKNALIGKKTDFVPQLIVGQEVVISLCRITPEVYQFWKDYENFVLFGGSQFVSAGSLHGNIVGGYGIWSAQGASEYYLKVE